MAHTSLKTHLLRMTVASIEYESDKHAEALQGSNKTVQVMHQTNWRRLVAAHSCLMLWQPTIKE